MSEKTKDRQKEKRKYSLRDENRQRKYLTTRERKRFFKVIRRLENPNRRLFLLTLFFTGARISEILELEIQHIDIGEGCLVLETLKKRIKGDYREIAIPHELLKELISIDSLHPKTKIFGFSRTTAWRVVKQVMTEAGIEGVQACPKGLRHSFALSAIEHDIPITRVKEWMGHESLSTTEIYLSVMKEEDRALMSRMWKGFTIQSSFSFYKNSYVNLIRKAGTFKSWRWK